MSTFTNFYFLKNNRANFELDVRKDAKLVFGYTKLKDLVDSMLGDATISGTPPKSFWWGQYGCGKTHHLHYTEQTINAVMPFRVVRFDLPEVTSKSLFNDLQLNLVTRIDLAYFRPLLISRYQADLTWLQHLSIPPDVRQAFNTIISNEMRALEAWRFLAGIKTDDPGGIGVTKKQLTEGEEFAAAIATIAEVIHLQENKMLLYLIDEAEGLSAVTNADSQKKWAHSLRKCLDLRVGFVLAIAAEKQQYIPEILQAQEVWRRVGDDYIVALQALRVPEIEGFLRGLLHAFIDEQKLIAAEGAGTFANYPLYDRSTFPFTQEALTGYAKYLGHNQQNSKPSEILKNLQKISHAAVRVDKRVIDKDFLTTAGPDGQSCFHD
ncbi:MAG TPA: hypothetical protein VGO67_04775 [Verrucomicrobiae bacterium]|jgi:hypothetical protein